MADEGTRFLVIVKLGNADKARLRTLVPKLQTVLKRVSTEPYEQLFRSVKADTFGYLIRAKITAREILAVIESPHRGSIMTAEQITAPFLDNDDATVVIEIGEDFMAGQGFTRAGAWLQHH